MRSGRRGRAGGSVPPSIAASRRTCQGKHWQPDPFPAAAGAPVYPGGEAGEIGGPPSCAESPFPTPQQFLSREPISRGATGLPMALVLGAVLLVTGATAVSPALPAPRDLARSVLETHGQELRLLKTFDWGTHFSINFTARQPACPKNGPERHGGCRARPGRAQRCTAQVSVFAFLPDVPLSMVECGQEPQPSGSAQPGTLGAAGTSAGHPSSSSSSSPWPPPRPRPRVSLLGTSRRPLSPAALE
ncbi:uncharacterized protein [Patagioenas fasciata]|uniref:uncharacterized protein isoform X3 n=1 Tax=Patagioenas fasciata TaxID=372321 RepID=UPI003A996A62